MLRLCIRAKSAFRSNIKRPQQLQISAGCVGCQCDYGNAIRQWCPHPQSISSCCFYQFLLLLAFASTKCWYCIYGVYINEKLYRYKSLACLRINEEIAFIAYFPAWVLRTHAHTQTDTHTGTDAATRWQTISVLFALWLPFTFFFVRAVSFGHCFFFVCWSGHIYVYIVRVYINYGYLLGVCPPANYVHEMAYYWSIYIPTYKYRARGEIS